MPNDTSPTSIVDTVLKLGGRSLADTHLLGAAQEAIGDAASDRRLLVVPGGGPFADVVRQTDQRVSLSDDAAHWMAILAMDQSAHLVAQGLDRGVVVASRREIGDALGIGQIPVLAPSGWLQEVDPLPHSWDVTGDSIAAWVAGRVGASSLILVKPPAAKLADVNELVDPYFQQTLPEGVRWTVVPADQVGELSLALRKSKVPF